ncbi:hypothetical protein PROFUN_12194 [Planoprotostelium fungivorum]|uniref:CNNM transmembrane domain-containing protein n=1 Tax=Planoprotostelium fungivorum TaxID=1890364 RepID=A0A2P6N8I7_9EUKA|nr:hypothetical protein PROFUN_12194 [Planoprotostelium fungivorum]
MCIDVPTGVHIETNPIEPLPPPEEDPFIMCHRLTDGKILCGNETYTLVIPEHVMPLAEKLIFIGISIGLVLVAGLMSGLTLGLMSLDRMNLQILIQSGTPHQKKHAGRILPLLDYHHWLLVTLLLCNSAAMEALPIFLDKLVSEYIAIAISVTAVLLFGEIIPQAICIRFGMAVGSKTAWVVRILMWLTAPISWPLGKILDTMFGCEPAQKYQRHELRELVNMHAFEEGPLSAEECNVIMGAIDLKGKTVIDCMTPIDKVYMIDCDATINRQLIDQLNADGHSRVPVYQGNRDCLVGLLLVKKLVGVDTEKGITVHQLMREKAPMVFEDKPLYEQLQDFQTGRSHMAVVWNPKTEKVSGIITLEDLIEELLQTEIEDEADVRRNSPFKTPLLSRKKEGKDRRLAFLSMSAMINSPIMPRNSPLVKSLSRERRNQQDTDMERKM